MRSDRVLTPRAYRLVAAMVFIVALVTPGVALGVMQSPVVSDAALTAGGAAITVQWTAPTGAVGPIQYELWWNEVPMTTTNYSTVGALAKYFSDNADVVFTSADNTMTVTVRKEIGQQDAKFTQYYMVIAKDLGNGSLTRWSLNITPQVHGGSRTGYDVNNCQLCHTSVHGAAGAYLGAASRWKCYRCHGNTDAASTVGSHALRNVEGEFYDYQGQVADRDGDSSTWASQTGEWTGSRHYNSYLVTQAQECTVCHSGIFPHRSPYYVDPLTEAYNATKSYTQLLEVELGASGTSPRYFYSTDQTPAGNNFCFQCHGTSTTVLDYNAGAGAYANSAGDHQASYSTAIHNSSTVLVTPGARATNPGIQCEVCHEKHASAADKLIAYRDDDTKDATTTYAQAELCYACHSNASADPAIAAAYLKPYSWNDRDVKFEFGRTGSRHPVTTAGGQWVPVSSTAFSQTSQAEFATDTPFQTSTSLVPDSVVLAQFNQSSPIPPEKYLFFHRTASIGVMDAYKAAAGTGGTWNTPFDPANDTGQFQSATGSTLFTAGGNVYRTRGGSTTSPMIRKYTLGTDSTGSWGAAGITQFNTQFNTGSRAAVNAKDSVVYITQAGGVSNVINWWQYSGTTENQMTFSGGTLGYGSGIAYSPVDDRLWVVYRNGATTANGKLYRLNTPGVQTGNPAWTDTGVQVSRTDNTGRYGDLAHFKNAAGADFLGYIGRDDTSRVFTILSGLNGTPTPLRLTGAKEPCNGTLTLADGCDLEWDGVNGGYLYATIGGANTTVKRIQIPADPKADANWGTWETITALPGNADVGSGITVADVDLPGSSVVPNYYGTGTITTGDVNPVAGSVAWGSVSFTEVQPANTGMTVTVQGWNGSAWIDLVTSDTSPIGLGSYPIATYTKLRLRANLSTSAPLTATPRLDDWSVTSMTQVWQPSGSAACVSCHNVHAVEEGVAGTAWDLARVSNPDDTQSNFDDTAGTVGDFCLKCHDGTPPNTAANSATVLVPYDVGFRSFDVVTSPFFFGTGLWNKSTVGADWAGSRHNAVAAIANDCGTCHDPHSSDFDNLTAYTGGAQVRANTNAAVSKEENLCYAANGCHNAAATKDVQTPMAATYSHTAESIPDAHVDTEGSARITASRHSECVDCHDPHAATATLHTEGDSAAGGAIRGAGGLRPTYDALNAYSGTGDWLAMNKPVGFEPARILGGTEDFEALVCLKCHSLYSFAALPVTVTRTGGTTFTTTDIAAEFNPSNMSEHNVFGQRTVMGQAFTVNGTTYTWPKPTGAFLKSPWTSDSEMTCTACHTENAAGSAKGPHGSTYEWIIAPWGAKTTITDYESATLLAYNATTAPDCMTADVICAKCHTNLTGTGANRAHAENAHWGVGDGECIDCHIKIPHGWKRPRLLGYSTDPLPYRSTGLSGIELMTYTTGGPGENDCSGGGCGQHSNAGVIWP